MKDNSQLASYFVLIALLIYLDWDQPGIREIYVVGTCLFIVALLVQASIILRGYFLVRNGASLPPAKAVEPSADPIEYRWIFWAFSGVAIIAIFVNLTHVKTMTKRDWDTPVLFLLLCLPATMTSKAKSAKDPQSLGSDSTASPESAHTSTTPGSQLQ